jgi:hypothetical protein
MANTFQFSSNSTFDDELDRYAEAAETEQSSIGLNPNVVKKRVYNQETNTTDLFASISGGFVKIGEEPLSALADLERYDQSLRSMGVAPTADDFYAAGFDDAVISESGILDAALPLTEPVAPEKTGRVAPLTSAEQEQIIAQGGDIAAQRSQTMRETLVQGQEFDPAARGELISGISYDPMSGAAFDPLTGELIPGGLAAGIESTVNIIAEVVGATGIDPKFARQIAEGIMGNANATRDFGLGLADFTPAGLFLGAQEGYKTFQRGKASGDGITMGAGILEAGLSLLEALPITVVAAKALKETAIPALREALISLGRGADARIAERGNALFSNPVAPLVDQALVAAKGFFTTQVPDVNAFVVLASKGKLQQARTLNQDILDISKKKMSGTVLNINTADDKTSMMYETGKLTQQLKDKGLFIDDDRMGTIYVGTTQENLNAIKNAKTPAEIGKLSGYSDADIAAFYLKRRGGNKDLAFQEYQSDTANLAAPQSLDAQVEAARLAYEGKPNDAALKKEYFDLRTQRDAMPIAEVQAPTKDTPGIIAFSGSGKDFDQFSLKYINTGEGEQAYGDGLYFSDSESIATFYKNAVRQTQNLREGYDVSYKGKKFKNLGDTADAEAQGLEYGAISSIIDNLNRVTTMGTKELPQQELLKLAKENLIKSKEAEKLRFEKDYGDSEDLSKRIIESFDDEIKAIDAINVDDLSFSEGKTYKVNLEVKPNELLNYDKTFDEQPPFVQKAILKALNEITIDDAYNIGIDLFSPPYNGNEKMAIRDAQKLMLNNFNTARFLNDWAAIRGSRDAGEKLLDKHGVKGITYKANRGSGNAAEGGPNNYVIFDDRLIQILEKYGIVGPVALSVLTAEGGKGEGKTNGY